MSRTRAEDRCPKCGNVPKPNELGFLVCGCAGKSWFRELGIVGSNDQESLLRSKGFQRARDIRGDVYYVGPGSRIVWLYQDGSWAGEKDSESATLENYLSKLSDVEPEPAN